MTGAYIQHGEPLSTLPATPRPTPIRRGAPVVFLNPDVLLNAKPVAVTMKPGDAAGVIGLVEGPGMRNASVEAFNLLCTKLRPVIVITDNASPYDRMSQLQTIGARFELAVDRKLDREDSDRAGAITRWRAAHGNPVSIVIDRPGVHPRQTVTVTIPETHEFTGDVLEKILALPSVAAIAAQAR